MPWLSVNQTRLLGLRAVPPPVLALDVHAVEFPAIPGQRILAHSLSLSFAVVSKKKLERPRKAFGPRTFTVGSTFLDHNQQMALVGSCAVDDFFEGAYILDDLLILICLSALSGADRQEHLLWPVPQGLATAQNSTLGEVQRWALQKQPAKDSRPGDHRIERDQGP